MARYMLGQVLLEAGAPVDALRIFRNVLARTPSLHRVRVDIAQTLALRGIYDRATATLDEIPTTAPAYQASLIFRCRHALWRHDGDAARRVLRGMSATGSAPASVAGSILELYALALEGKSTRLFPANRVAGDGVGFPPRRRTVVCQFYTELDAFNGHWELALEHLDSAVAHGLQDTFWMDRCPTLDELRGSARFESLRSIVRVRAERALATLDEVRPPKG
jgi:serine/threonine-protein kinase